MMGKLGAHFCAGGKRQTLLTSSPKDFGFLLDRIKQWLFTSPQIPTVREIEVVRQKKDGASA